MPKSGDRRERNAARRQIIKKLVQRLSDEFEVVFRPDHPFLLAQPDILIGKDGILTAVFLPKSSEKSDPDALLTRLAFSRLALPEHSKCVLVTDTEDASLSGLNHVAGNGFHEALTFAEVNSIFSLARDAHLSHRLDEIPFEIRRAVYSRSVVLFDESHKMFERFSSSEKNPYETIDELVEYKRYRQLPLTRGTAWHDGVSFGETRYVADEPKSINLTFFGTPEADDRHRTSKRRLPALSLARGDSIAAATGNLSSAPMGKLRRLFSIGMQMHYKLDRGVPYPARGSPFVNILLTDKEMPRYRSDPAKLLRAGAFAGWLFMPGVSVAQLERTGRSLLHRLEKMRLL